MHNGARTVSAEIPDPRASRGIFPVTGACVWLCLALAPACLQPGEAWSAGETPAPQYNRTIAEDIAHFSWARVTFRTPVPKSDPVLRFYAYQYFGNTLPVGVEVNGHALTYASESGQGKFSWHEITVPRGCFTGGVNHITFTSDTPSARTWALAIEHADHPRGSARSTDRGKTWYAKSLGYNFSVVGQYAVRLFDSGGNPLMVTFLAEKEAAPRVLETSQVMDLAEGGSDSDFIQKLILTAPETAPEITVEARYGCTPFPDGENAKTAVRSWTPWQAISLENRRAELAPVRFRYFQWRALGGATPPPGKSVPKAAVTAERKPAGKGRFEGFSFEKVFSGAELEGCPRDQHLDPSAQDGVLGLRRGEIVKDEEGNAQLNIDRSAITPPDTLGTPWWLGEQVTDTVWIRKDLTLESPETGTASLLFFYQIWSHAARKGIYWSSTGGSSAPLRISINGMELPPVTPDDGARNRTEDWRRVDFPKQLLKRGVNTVIIRADKGGDWRFAYENSTAPNRSARSIDAGKTWNYNRLGENGLDDGEYLVRFLLERYHDSGMVWSEPIALWNTEAGSYLRRVRNLSLTLSAEGNTPAGTQIRFQVRFGTDAVPDNGFWTDWGALSTGKTLSVKVPGEDFRYIQWRAVLRTASTLATPRLSSVRARVRGEREVSGDERHVTVAKLENPPLRLGSMPLQYDTYGNGMLDKLREWHHLDEVVKNGRTELEKLILLAGWVNDSRYRGAAGAEHNKKYGIPRQTTHWAPNNALWALDMFDRGFGHLDNRFGSHCHDYNWAFVGCCEALGFIARPLIMNRSDASLGGHSFPEVWSNEFQRWVYIDAYTNKYFLRDDGVPANTMEIHQAQFDSTLFKSITAFALPHADSSAAWVKNSRQPPVEACPAGYEMFGIWPRGNYMDQPSPYPIWDGVLSFRWDGRLWYDDPRVPPQTEFSNRSPRGDDLYFSLNQCYIQPEYRGRDMVMIRLSQNMPNFRCYEVRPDGASAWTEHRGDFVYQLHPGDNTLEVRPVNQWGIRGGASRVTISNKLPG